MKQIVYERSKDYRKFFWILLFGLMNLSLLGQNLERYQPQWIRGGFADGGATHEPWMFQVRRNDPGFNLWERERFNYQLSEEYIKSLAEAGVTVYHIFCYKGYGFEAEKESMRSAAKAAAIAHKYGMKVDTYIQWNNMFYETFFEEVPEAETDKWYKIDEVGRPIILGYAYAPYRLQICLHNEAYRNYFKEKILRYAVDSVKTDFVHFDNFNSANPYHPEYNEPTLAAFRKYIEDKYTIEQRLDRFGFSNVSHVLPPIWNDDKHQRFDSLKVLNDPVMQEWCDFRCWSKATHLTEFVRFIRSLNKEVVIEVNSGGVSNGGIWRNGTNHSDVLQYTNVIWAEGHSIVQWKDGYINGKFMNYKLGRTTNNFILCYNRTPQGNAEKLAYNRAPAWLGYGIPQGVTKQYLDFWHAHKKLYTNASGAEKVAILFSYPTMAYNLNVPNPFRAAQILQQQQIPYDIIFDQQLDSIEKYSTLILANQENLADTVIEKIVRFVKQGGGLVVTGRTGMLDHWRRLRKPYGLHEIFGDLNIDKEWAYVFYTDILYEEGQTATFGRGRAIYLPDEKDKSMFKNAVLWAAGKKLPLTVNAPEWVGVSHDTQQDRDIVHLVNYRKGQPVPIVTLELASKVKKAWAVSPDREFQMELVVDKNNGNSIVYLPDLKVYEVVVLEK